MAQRGVHCLYTTHYNTVEVTTRRVVTTDVTPSPHGSARCPLLVHYTLHHVPAVITDIIRCSVTAVRSDNTQDRGSNPALSAIFLL
ncbi:hypothetical protein J6590_085227 [Homalodisca vitripennis]|nr:hypothetical protein J6590_085227 [Homalodisca vitripennis]